MGIVTVTMVRNEEDIVETFVRYHAELVDYMIILDNGSRDLTSEILAKLRLEGLPVHVIYDAEPAFVQSEFVTSMVREAFALFGANVVIPLDVDEFLAGIPPGELRGTLRDLAADEPTYLAWRTYVPLSTDFQDELNPLIRIRTRRAIQHNHDFKVCIPRAVFEAWPDLVVSQGSHCLYDRSGARLSVGQQSEKLALLHYPVRSVHQMQSKYLIGWLANLARPKRVLFDWLPEYNRVKRSLPTRNDVTAAALHYNILDKDSLPGLIEDPADLSHLSDGIRLRYTTTAPSDVMRNVLEFAEELADRLSLARGRSPLGDQSLSERLILDIIGDFQSIGGWLSVKEAALLYRVAASLPSESSVACEIGSWMGRSTFVLASAFKLRSRSARLLCIDPLDGSGDSASAPLYESEIAALDVPLEEVFWRNMRRRGVADNIELIRARSSEASGMVPKRIDFLFIDGDHSVSAVTKDFELYAPRIREGGFIALHDVGSISFNGPKTVVERYIVPSTDWTAHTLVDELFVAQRAPSQQTSRES